MQPDLNAMALFVLVIQHKSFTEASKRLGMPISTVSRKVSELEKTLGIRLIERSTRKLRLTETGEEYFQYCRRGLEEFEAGALMISDKQSDVMGALRLSIPPNISEVLVSPIICDYQMKYPKTTVNVLVTERNVDLIEDGVDIALRVGELQDSMLAARQLLNYRHLLVASPQYIEVQGNPQKPDELVAHRLLSFSGWREQTYWEFFKNRQSQKIPVNSCLSINEMTGLQYATEHHQGIASLPAFTCSSALEQERLVEVMPEWRFASTVLSAIYPSNRNTSRLVKCFMDCCSKTIEQQVEQKILDTGL